MTLEAEFLTSLMPQAGNHLWQSTAFAAAAFLLALALKATPARARYWVWMAASVKFLVPFALLASLGSTLGSLIAPKAPTARVPFAVEQIVQPFAAPEQGSPAAIPVPAVLLGLWLVGFAAVLFHWWKRWRRVRAAVHASVPLREGREADALHRLRSKAPPDLPSVELVSSTAKLEPGLLGILRPILWLPAGIADRLSERELDAILAHELCHAQRRDNLTAVIHMAVEAVFWFHPLVWWLGGRLVEERERACDEQVVLLSGEPQAYAEGILKICEFYVASPLACAAGVTGADLRRRIEGIMASLFLGELCRWQKLLLTVLLAAAVACPCLVGVFKAGAQVSAIREFQAPQPALGATPQRVVPPVPTAPPVKSTDVTSSRAIAPRTVGRPVEELAASEPAATPNVSSTSGVKQITVPGSVQQAKLISQVRPVYPRQAREARIQGMVRFGVLIGTDGHVASIQLVSGHPLLASTAQEAVQQWIYQPTLLDGQPVEVLTEIALNFTLQ